MDRALALGYHAAIPVGHRVEIGEFGEQFAVVDLDTGIRYLPAGDLGAVTPGATWQGRVQACTVSHSAEHPHTMLVVAAESDGAADQTAQTPAEEAIEALGGADAAFAAAMAEAQRWSSTPVEPVQPEWRG